MTIALTKSNKESLEQSADRYTYGIEARNGEPLFAEVCAIRLACARRYSNYRLRLNNDRNNDR